MSQIKEWAKAIQREEGGKPNDLNMRLCNPGNLKYSTLTASWGGTRGKQATDGGWICKFKDYPTGLQALCYFLTLGAEDHLRAFHKARTLIKFTKVYANPPDNGYAKRIAQSLGVSPDVLIDTFLIQKVETTPIKQLL